MPRISDQAAFRCPNCRATLDKIEVMRKEFSDVKTKLKIASDLLQRNQGEITKYKTKFEDVSRAYEQSKSFIRKIQPKIVGVWSEKLESLVDRALFGEAFNNLTKSQKGDENEK